MPFPQQRELIRDLVLNDHVALEDTPLSLAIYFGSRRVPNEECVFEVLHHFGFDEVSEERTIFQVQFGRTHNFPLPEGDRLRLFLTNPTEIIYAMEHGWPEINDLRDAIGRGDFEVIYRRPGDFDADKVLNALKGSIAASASAAVAA